MRGLTKQLSLLTAIVLLVSVLVTTASAAPLEDCPGSCSHAAAIGTTHYDTLEEAVAAVNAGSSITLLTNTTLSSPVTLDKSLSLNLGGKTLTGGVVFTKGGTVKNGKIVAVSGPAVQVSGCTVAIEKDAVLVGCDAAPALSVTAGKDASAQVNVSGTVTGKGTAPVIAVKASEGSCQLNILKNAKVIAEDNAAIAFDSAGKLEISGGTIQGNKDLITLQINKDRKTEVAITDGKLLSKEGEVVVITAQNGADVPKDFVTGGTFNKAPTAYIPSYSKPQTNSDGTTTIRSTYTITFLSGGANGTMEPVKVKCGSAYTLPKSGFTANGKDFAGWQIGSKIYAAGASYTPDGDVTITATWKDHVHTGGKATCQKKAVCSVCGKTYGKLGSHNLSYIGGYAPTCDSTGMNAHSKCSSCGELFVNGSAVSADSLSIAALGHNWESREGAAATCTEDGQLPHRACTVCGLIQLDGKDVEAEALVISATDHILEEVAATESACTMAGIQAHQHCTTCDERFQNGRSVKLSELTTALASHVLSEEWHQDEIYHWKTCVSCNEVFRQNRHTDTDANNICDDCGYELAPQAEQNDTQKKGFPWYLLIPVVAAAIIVPPIVKKRKGA